MLIIYIQPIFVAEPTLKTMITLKPTELRIGNILNYTTPEGDVMPITIDWQGLKWISEDPKGFNLVHDEVPITEETLPKSGFIRDNDRSTYSLEGTWYHIIESNGEFVFRGLGASVVVVKSIHHLQNLYHAITSEELNIEL